MLNDCTIVRHFRQSFKLLREFVSYDLQYVHQVDNTKREICLKLCYAVIVILLFYNYFISVLVVIVLQHINCVS